MVVKDFYGEKGVVAKPNMKKKAAMWTSAVLAVLCLIGAFFLPLCLLFSIAAIILFILLFRERYVEYDYCIANEEIEVAKVLNRSRRRKAISFDTSNIRLIAPGDSIRLSNEAQRNPQLRFTDYTSMEPTDRVYGFVLDLQGVSTLILLEPTESMMKHLKRLIPDKVYED